MTTTREHLAALIRESRLRAGLTQAQLGIPAMLVWSLEHPDKQGPKPGAPGLVKVAAALDLDAAELCAMAGTIHPEIKSALSDPAFQATVLQLAKEHQK